jgi:NAD(P)-dependent dehydrogenase (short-subunit alcohol dehydrogenase family)
MRPGGDVFVDPIIPGRRVGPAEAFTPEQFAELYDVNVLSTQRVNRAALPQLRRQGRDTLGYRNIDHRSRCFYRRHEPLRSRRVARRRGTGR